MSNKTILIAICLILVLIFIELTRWHKTEIRRQKQAAQMLVNNQRVAILIETYAALNRKAERDGYFGIYDFQNGSSEGVKTVWLCWQKIHGALTKIRYRSDLVDYLANPANEERANKLIETDKYLMDMAVSAHTSNTPVASMPDWMVNFVNEIRTK